MALLKDCQLYDLVSAFGLRLLAQKYSKCLQTIALPKDGQLYDLVSAFGLRLVAETDQIVELGILLKQLKLIPLRDDPTLRFGVF